MFVDVKETVLNYDGIIVIIIGLQIFMKIRTFIKIVKGKSFIYFWRLKFLSKLKHRSICQTKK